MHLRQGVRRRRAAASGPELVDPQIEMHEAVGADRVDAPRALAGHRHQLAVEQRLQMLGDGWAADVETIGQLVDGPRLAAQFLEQVAPVGIGDGLESIHGHAVKLV